MIQKGQEEEGLMLRPPLDGKSNFLLKCINCVLRSCPCGHMVALWLHVSLTRLLSYVCCAFKKHSAWPEFPVRTDVIEKLLVRRKKAVEYFLYLLKRKQADHQTYHDLSTYGWPDDSLVKPFTYFHRQGGCFRKEKLLESVGPEVSQPAAHKQQLTAMPCTADCCLFILRRACITLWRPSIC